MIKFKTDYTKNYYSKYGILILDRPYYPNESLIIIQVKDRPFKKFLVSKLILSNHNYIADIHLQPY